MIPTRPPSRPGTCSTRAVEEVDHVVEVHRSHRLPDGAPVLLAVSRGAAGVAHHDRVSRSRVDLRLVEEAAGVRREGAAVDVQQHRMRSLALGHHDPAVDGVAVTARRS